MSVIFNQIVREGRNILMPGVVLAFEDPDAEPYFVAMGWAEQTDAEPVMTYTQDEVSVDPLARSAETGKYVLPERAVEMEAGQQGEQVAPEESTHG